MKTKGKRILSLALIIFVIISVGYLIFKEVNSPERSGVTQVKRAEASDTGVNNNLMPDNIIIYYFHNNRRCPTCHKIETLTEKTVKENFGAQLQNGKIQWKVINVEEEGNQHFTQDYQLQFQSVVLVGMRDGKQVSWKNLNKVWELVYNEPAFSTYVKDEINSFMGKS